jgi:NAD(P)-dependent dehydrogenase (short-subunit alcohol dehydrogenase family)
MPDLSGQNLLVIGGSSGIGLAVAKLAASQGANIVISSSNQTKIDAAVKEIQKAVPGVSAKGFPCDLSKESVEADLNALFDKSGSLQHVIYTAADSLAMTTLDQIDYDFIVKAGHMRFSVPLLLAKIVSKRLPKSNTTSLTFTSGTIAHKAIPNWSVIASYAGGHISMVRNLAVDMAPMRVNAVLPGYVNTGLWGDYLETISKIAAEESLLGRMAEPDEVAESYVYLLRNTFSTGSCVDVNGGTLCK